MNLRHFYNSELSLSVLPPAHATELTSEQHESAIAEIQQFRGGVYLRDGAIPAEALDESGRHQSDADYSSYHLLIRTSSQQVCACLRIHWHGLSGDYESLDCQQYFPRMSPGVAR